MTNTLELKVTDDQLNALASRAEQRGVDSPAQLLAELVRNDLKQHEEAQEARREAVAQDLEKHGWINQARKIREGELQHEQIELSYD